MAAPPGSEVQAMFAEIAPRYDLLNRVLSFGIDRRWRETARRRLDLAPGQDLLDLCCGTGDLALQFARHGIRVLGADFTAPMLPLARAKAERRNIAARWVRADAQSLPFAAASFDAVTIAFGIRNVEDPQRALAECQRVLRPGGQLAVLEFFAVEGRLWGPLFRFYFRHLLPRLAWLVRAGRGGAYRYLPESVDGFARPDGFAQWMSAAGFEEVSDQPLSGGVARLLIGRTADAAATTARCTADAAATTARCTADAAAAEAAEDAKEGGP